MRNLVFLFGLLVGMTSAQDLWNQFEGAPVSSVTSVSSSSVVVLPSSSSLQALTVIESASQDSLAKPQLEDSLATPLDSAPVDAMAVGGDSSSSLSSVVQSSVVQSSSAQNLSSSSSQIVIPSSASVDRRELLGPVKVSRVRGIDELKGRYKSPRKALFMSLVLPGSGQLYVGGSTFNIARGVGYLLAEGVLAASWYHYSVTLYDRQVNKYEKYARDHFSIGLFEQNLMRLYSTMPDGDREKDFNTLYLAGREEYCHSIYGSTSQPACYENSGDGKAAYLNDALNNHASQFSQDSTLGADLKRFGSLWDEEQFYQILAQPDLVIGWMDLDNASTYAQLDLEAQNYVKLGESAFQTEYQGQRARANEIADMQAWFLGGILLNHLVSAVDATLTAHAHNKALYEEKVSWYDQIRLESQMGWGNGFGVDFNAAVKARLDF